MSASDITPESYAAEPVRFGALEVVDLAGEASAVRDRHRNMVISRVNGHCLRLAVLEGDYPWHVHPTSDEMFVVLKGHLTIELASGGELRLGEGQCTVVPAGVVHRTRGIGRTVNLCFEEFAAETVFTEPSADSRRERTQRRVGASED